MGIDGIGSSVVIALAAVLWFLYLVPTWLKRREYLATERNAVRLQQTMRIMAESAELPAVVRVEASARSAAAHERALRRQQRGSDRRSAGADTRWLSSAQSARIETSRLPARRLRRSRALASLVLLASLVAAGFGVSALMSTGSWVLLAASVVVAVGALALLGQAASVARARAELRRVEAPSRVVSELHDDADFAEERRPGWIPVPIPRPLYLSRPADNFSLRDGAAIDDRSQRRAQPVSTGASEPFDHAAALRAAAAEAERALRAAQAEPEVARIRRPVTPVSAPEAPSRFARMGVVDAAEVAPADLDDILRRRREVG